MPAAAGPSDPAVPATATLQAVLWDMDGTLVDTEPYWIEAETALVTAHGGSWSDAQAKSLVGQALEYSASVLQQAGVPLTIREIIDALTAHVVERVRAHIPWRPGARELLADLHASGVPCALVTMSEAPLAGAVNAQLPSGSFRFLVTGDQVTHGKPDPEAYLDAISRMSKLVPGLDTDRVVAIEDSIPGVTAAQGSGAVTLAVPHFVPVPGDSGRTVWPTLAGRSTADLQSLVNERLAGVPAAPGAGC